jgi:hypothetical protein
MALDSAAVDVAVTGAVMYAPAGSAAPTDADSPMGAPYLDIGYISSDGVVEARDRSTSNIVAWQNADVVRSVVTEASITVAFTGIETNKPTLELFYGAALNTVDGSIKIVPGAAGTRRSVVVDYIDGTKYVRLWLPQAELQEVGETTLTSGGDPVGYNMTLRGYPDAALGASAQKWFSELVGV